MCVCVCVCERERARACTHSTLHTCSVRVSSMEGCAVCLASSAPSDGELSAPAQLSHGSAGEERRAQAGGAGGPPWERPWAAGSLAAPAQLTRSSSSSSPTPK